MWHVPQNKQSRSCVLWIACAVLVVTVFAGSCQALATEILVAAAADLNFAIKDIIAEFEQKTGHRVKLSLGSSGNFYSQISNGAPFEIFFSADIDFPRKLEEAHLTVPNTIFPYAVGRLVVWVTKESPIDVEKAGIDALLDPSVKKIAIANPRHAPYGRAAVAAMKHFGLHDKVESKFVLGENIAQTAQFIQSGNADIGIIALSLALAPPMRDKGRYWPIPLNAYPPLEQAGIILSWAKDLDATQRFKAFVTGTAPGEGRAILRRYGFVLPGE